MLTLGSNLNPVQSQSLSVQGYKRTAWAVEQLERDLGRGTAGTSQTLFWGTGATSQRCLYRRLCHLSQARCVALNKQLTCNASEKMLC